MLLVAFGCIGALVLAVASGITYLALTRGSDGAPVADPETTSSTSPSPPPTPAKKFKVVSPSSEVTGTPEQIRAVMADNPLTSGSITKIRECSIPATPVKHTPEQLQTLLDAEMACIGRAWSRTSSDRSLPWQTPKVHVFTGPEIPPSACPRDTFEEGFPRMCQDDGTLYWPVGYGNGAKQTVDANVPGAYLWDLSYISMMAVSWYSTVGIYYVGLDKADADDPDMQSEDWRRYSLQWRCIGAATVGSMPSAARPPQGVQDWMFDPAKRSKGKPGYEITQQTQVDWMRRGFTSGGDLTVCNTWKADAADVT